MSKVCNKQFITFGHCELWSHFTRTLYFYSPSARDNTVTSVLPRIFLRSSGGVGQALGQGGGRNEEREERKKEKQQKGEEKRK